MADATPPEGTPEGTPPEGAPPEGTPPTTTPETDAEVEKWKALSRKNERDLKKAQADLAAAQSSSMSEVERAVAEAKAQAREEALGEVLRDRVRDKVAIAAGGKLADPSDAAALLGDLDQFVVSGEIDTKAITAAIDALVKQKPYLSPQPGNGSGEGGPRGDATPPSPGDDPLLKAILEKTGFTNSA